MNVKTLFKNAISSPIPQSGEAREWIHLSSWKEIPISECGEPLVPLGSFVSPHEKDGFLKGQADVGFSDRIFQDAIYWSQQESAPYERNELKGALLTPFVREGIAKKLVQAASYLPKGYALIIWDTYRPQSVQKALFDDYYQQLVEKKGLNPEQALVKAQDLVSIPSDDPTRPPPHNTGASVDLSIIRFDPEVLPELERLNRQLRSKDWKVQYQAEMRRMQLAREHSTLLNMGTKFDAAMDQTETRYYEEKLAAGNDLSSDETEALENRRLLYKVMHSVGFSNYTKEWWHFDSGNQFDAKRSGRPVIYGAANYSEECAAWESMRVNHYTGSQLWRGPVPPMAKTGDSALVDLVRRVACKTGDLRATRHDKAGRLEA